MMRTGKKPLPEEFAFVTTEMAREIEVMRAALNDGRSVLFDIQVRLGGMPWQYNANYQDHVIIPVWSVRDYLFLRCALIREMNEAQREFPIYVGYHGRVMKHEQFDAAGDGPLLRLYNDLKDDKVKGFSVSEDNGAKTIHCAQPVFMMFQPSADNLRHGMKKDLCSRAAPVPYPNPRVRQYLLQKPVAGFKELNASLLVKPGVYVMAFPYISEKEAKLCDIKSKIVNLNPAATEENPLNIWLRLYYDVKTEHQVLRASANGSVEMPVFGKPGGQMNFSWREPA